MHVWCLTLGFARGQRIMRDRHDTRQASEDTTRSNATTRRFDDVTIQTSAKERGGGASGDLPRYAAWRPDGTAVHGHYPAAEGRHASEIVEEVEMREIANIDGVAVVIPRTLP